MKRVEQRVRYGFQLARRGAVYLAGGEFVAALHMIADANDAQQDTPMYSKALSAGLTAIREAGVFVRHPADRPDMDVQRIVETHRLRWFRRTAFAASRSRAPFAPGRANAGRRQHWLFARRGFSGPSGHLILVVCQHAVFALGCQGRRIVGKHPSKNFSWSTRT